jgi:hypothetical protein
MQMSYNRPQRLFVTNQWVLLPKAEKRQEMRSKRPRFV